MFPVPARRWHVYTMEVPAVANIKAPSLTGTPSNLVANARKLNWTPEINDNFWPFL